MAYYTPADYWTVATYPRETVRQPYYGNKKRSIAWLFAAIIPNVFIVGCAHVQDALLWEVGISNTQRFLLAVTDADLFTATTLDSTLTDLTNLDSLTYSVCTTDRVCND
jgi:hypothetical protein